MPLWLQDCGNIDVFATTAFSPNFISQLCPSVSKLSIQQNGVRHFIEHAVVDLQVNRLGLCALSYWEHPYYCRRFSDYRKFY